MASHSWLTSDLIISSKIVFYFKLRYNLLTVAKDCSAKKLFRIESMLKNSEILIVLRVYYKNIRGFHLFNKLMFK